MFSDFYENCGTVQCWKNEECCKMICHKNGTMIPDNQCFQTSTENPGCPLFVCEPPQTTSLPVNDDMTEGNAAPTTTTPKENEETEEYTDESSKTTTNQQVNVEYDRDVGVYNLFRSFCSIFSF